MPHTFYWRTLLLYSLALLVIVHGSALASKPNWVSERPVSKLYYTGIGSADKDQEEYAQVAKRVALSDLVSEISITIDSEIISRLVETDETLTREFQSQIRSSTSMDLEDYELVGSWESKERYWVYYRLSKRQYEAEKERRVSAAKKLAVEFLSRGQAEVAKGNIAQAIKWHVKALEALENYIGEPLEVQLSGNEVILNNEIVASVEGILSQITLATPTRRIKGKVSQPLAKPLQFTATYRTDSGEESRVEGLPIQFSFIRGKGDIVRSGMTDDRGVVTCHIAKIQANDRQQIVRANMQLSNWLGEDSSIIGALLKTLDGPRANVIIEVATVVASINSEEFNLGKALEFSYLEPVLKNAMAEQGFSFTDDPSQADLLVEITARTRKGAEVFGQFTAFLDLNISVLDMQSGEEIIKDSFQRIKGIDLSYENAGLKAYAHGGKKLVKDVLPGLLQVVRR